MWNESKLLQETIESKVLPTTNKSKTQSQNTILRTFGTEDFFTYWQNSTQYTYAPVRQIIRVFFDFEIFSTESKLLAYLLNTSTMKIEKLQYTLNSHPFSDLSDAQHHLYHLATCDANVRFRFVRWERWH